MIDMRQALKVRSMMRDPDEYHIGIIKNSFSTGMVLGGIRPGLVVLFRRDDGKTVTVDQPMSDEEITYQQRKGSGLTTYNTCVGVPKDHVEEILFEY